MNPSKAGILRIIDANLNRAREALRVLEEIPRLGRLEAELFRKIRGIRHGLAAIEKDLGVSPSQLAAARDPDLDPGRCAPAAGYRGVADLAAANMRRLEEALRAIEEFGRVLGAGSEAASKARFEAYALEKEFLPGLGIRANLEQAVLYYILDATAAARDPQALAREAIEGGADAIQLRNPAGPDRCRVELAAELAGLCSKSGTVFIVNDRLDIALASGADGVHLGIDDVPLASARRIAGSEFIVGFTVHSMEELALAGGADYIGAGTAYASLLKPERPAAGPAEVARICAASAVPAFAVGGINESNAGELASLGIRRIAVSTAISGSPDPAGTAGNLKRMMTAR